MVLGLVGFLILLPSVLFVSLIASAPGHVRPDGWGLLMVSSGGGIALIVTAIRHSRTRY